MYHPIIWSCVGVFSCSCQGPCAGSAASRRIRIFLHELPADLDMCPDNDVLHNTSINVVGRRNSPNPILREVGCRGGLCVVARPAATGWTTKH